MGFGDGLGGFEVGEGAGDAEDFVVGARAEAELVDGGLQEFVGAALEHAVLSRGGGVDMRVAGEDAIVTTSLDVARGLDLAAYFRARRAALFLVRDLFVAEGGHVDV